MNAAILSLTLSLLLAPPVETAAQPSTRVYVHTDPAGAAVKLDGQPVGKSDDLFVVPAGVGKMTIEVELDGHYPQRQEVAVRGGQITRVDLKMQRRADGDAGQKPSGPPTGDAQAKRLKASLAAKIAAETPPAKIERVVVKGQKAVIEGQAGADSRIVVKFGAEPNWNCRFGKAMRFTASIGCVGQGLDCLLNDADGKSLLYLPITQMAGVKLDQGRIVFHEGTPAARPNGEYLIADFQPENGASIPIAVQLDNKGGPAVEKSALAILTLQREPVVTRTVNKLVSDFPEKIDLSTPEGACAAYQRASARKDGKAVSQLSWVPLDPGKEDEWYRREEAKDPEGLAIYLKALAEAKIVEVHAYRGELTDVVTYLPFAPGKGRHPFSRRSFGRINGEWKNLGEDRLPSLDAARVTFEQKKDFIWEQLSELKRKLETKSPYGSSSSGKNADHR